MKDGMTESIIAGADRERKANNIKQRLFDRFGKIAHFDSKTGTMDIHQAQSFDDIQVKNNIMHNCGEVSRVVNLEIQGVRYEAQVNGSNPAIFYSQGGHQDIQIASGLSSAFHAFIVDRDGKVWDPIVDEWGESGLDAYLNNLKSTNEVFP